MEQENIVFALDIGTTKICAMAGRKNQYGQLEILGYGKVDSHGVLRGVVANIDKTIEAIREAVAIAERKSGLEFTQVNVGIAGQHINSLQHRGLITRDSHDEIGKKDIIQLKEDMNQLVLPPGDKIIHIIPQEYTVDGEQGIVDPIGIAGVRLEANFHIITGQVAAAKNIRKCVEQAGLQIASMTLEPIASAEATLSEQEKEAGVALVDIGGGTTDLAIFHEGIIRHTAVISFGGDIITRDIKSGCRLMQSHAEKLKVKYGCAMAREVYDNRVIAIPAIRGEDHEEIQEKNLAHIIQARMEEIIEQVNWEIKSTDYEDKLLAGIVLTGGGSLLRHVDKLTEFKTGKRARIGEPIEHLAHGFAPEVCSPIFSTSVGLILKAYDQGLETLMSLDSRKRKGTKRPWYNDIFEKTKKFFDNESDTIIK